MWRDGTFAFDANVLLNLYRYQLETRDALFRILERLSDRIWIPHQAAFEYHRSRPTVIAGQLNAYGKIESALNKILNGLQTELSQYKRHFTLDIDSVIAPIQNSIDSARSKISEARARHPDLLDQDPIRDRITRVFDGRVGAAYTNRRREEIKRLADKRLTDRLPPGYADLNKNNPENQRGDVIMWLQVIDKACETRRPLIFITDDAKDDWWLIHGGKTLGPRPELIEEMAANDVLFYMYSSSRFVEEAERFLKGRGLGKTKLTKALRDMEEVALEQAMSDSLTGLYNRRWLDQRLEELINNAQTGGPPVTLLMIDVDNFTRINTWHGHLLGDKVLQSIALTMSAVVGSQGEVVRFGGEEFAIVLDAVSPAEASHLAERVRESIARQAFRTRRGTSLYMTVSIGIATWSKGIDTVRKLIDKASAALDQAKTLGKNRVVVADDS